MQISNESKKILKRLFISLSIVLIIFFLMLFLGRNMFLINPYDSGLNDEAFYLKQIKSIMFYGSPQGYFGYNDSSAKIGGFGAWSPLILYIYAIFGILFRSSNYVVYIVNLMIVVLSLFYLFQSNKLNTKEMLVYLIPISTFLGLRYSYSGMVEALYYSAIILIFASYINKKKNYFGLLIIFLASLTRPYFLLFILIFIFKDEYNKKEYLAIGLLSFLSLLVYVLTNYFLQAAYLFPQVRIFSYLVFLRDYGINGFLPMIKSIFVDFFSISKEIFDFIRTDFIKSDEPAVGYAIFVVTSIYVLINLFIKKNKKYMLMFFILIVEYIVVVILYYFKPGFRHIYIVLLLVWYLIINENKDNKLLLISLLLISSTFTYFYFKNSNRWGIYPAQEPYVIKDNTNFINNYDMSENTVYIELGIDWDTYRVMNNMPDYYGYNICLSDYVPNLKEKKSGYIVISNKSENIELFKDRKIIFKNERVTIFEL